MTEARMQEVPEYKPGTFCWVELGTTDANAAKTFYTQLFDWDYTDSPAGPDMIYTMLKLDGKDVGGLYQLSKEMLDHGTPAHWLSYVSVTNVDEAVEKAKEGGATVLSGPLDVMTVGRMAVIQDPTGAVVAFWQAGTHHGAGIYNVPSSFTWNELMTRDTQRAGDFYSNLFGWSTEPFPGPIEYTTFKNGDRGAGGMLKITPEMGPIPPNWLVYFAVDDCEAKARKATQLGGSVMKSPDDIPGVGRFAVLRDPQSAVFAIIKLEPRQA